MASPWQQWKLKGDGVMNYELWQGGVIHAASDIGTWQGTLEPRLACIFPSPYTSLLPHVEQGKRPTDFTLRKKNVAIS